MGCGGSSRNRDRLTAPMSLPRSPRADLVRMAIATNHALILRRPTGEGDRLRGTPEGFRSAKEPIRTVRIRYTPGTQTNSLTCPAVANLTVPAILIGLAPRPAETSATTWTGDQLATSECAVRAVGILRALLINGGLPRARFLPWLVHALDNFCAMQKTGSAALIAVHSLLRVLARLLSTA